MRILLLILLPCVGASALKRIIHRIAEKKTWVEAQAYCRLHHTDLLPIRDQAENEEISEDGWIGLFRESSFRTWHWSMTHVADCFCTWAPGEPDHGQNCGFKQAGDIGFHSKECDKPFPFYCVDDPLVLVEERKPWEEALEYCRDLTQHHPTVHKHHRYELASPLTLNEGNMEYVFQSRIQTAWIGLRYLGSQWRWLSGQQYDDKYANCPHVHRCGTLEKNVTINIMARRCEVKNNFLCARKSDAP